MMRNEWSPDRSKTVRWARWVVGAVAVLVIAVAAAIGLTGNGGGGRRPPPPVLSGATPAGPSASATWWSPVHGEPLGVAIEGGDIAAAALDEVRLIEVSSGRLRWKAVLAGVRRYRPALGRDHVAATSEAELVVFDRRDGARSAAVPFAGPGPAAVLTDRVGRPLVVAGSETGALLAVAPGADRPSWSVSYPGSVTVAPVSDGEVVVASWHTQAGAVLRALDLSTGAIRWELPLGPMAGAPLIASGAIVVADGEGVHRAAVRAVDLQTGRDRWQTPMSGWFDDELESAVDGDTVYLLDGMGSVMALDLASGSLRWRQDTGRPLVNGRVVLTPRFAVFASYDDELMVLERESGRLSAAEAQRGVPVDLATAGDRLVVAIRLGAPSRIEARPVP